MFQNSTRLTEERSEMVLDMGEKKELEKEKEASPSGSILARGATITDSSNPENCGSEESADEEFVLLPGPPMLVPGLLEDLEDALVGCDLHPAEQTDHSDGSNSDSSADSNVNQDRSSDPSENHHDQVHDVNSNGLVEEQEVNAGSHLPIVQTKLEASYTDTIERSGKDVEVKEEEEEQEESEDKSQWEDGAALLSGSTLDAGDTISASNDCDPENHGSARSFDEDVRVSTSSPSFVPGQIEDFEIEDMYTRPPPRYLKRSSRVSRFIRRLLPEQRCPNICPFGFCKIS